MDMELKEHLIVQEGIVECMGIAIGMGRSCFLQQQPNVSTGQKKQRHNAMWALSEAA